MSHLNANTVVKHTRCHGETRKGVLLRQVCYTYLSIFLKIVQLKRTFLFADHNLEIGRINF